ncbi:MAG: DNA-methyltransferase [Alphaproteobacteria bacterium]
MDCLIEQGVVVDCVLTDPPYGTTACQWDSVIPFDAMWERLNKLIKPNGAIVLFGSEPFSSALRMSNIKNYKYDWIWNKVSITNPMLAKKQPLRCLENVLVFYSKQPVYNPIMTKGNKWHRGGNKTHKTETLGNSKLINNGNDKTDLKFPKNLIEFSNADKTKNVHPTQKPVALMEYLIKTYTNENETILDFTMGSGTTGVACKNLNRDFIEIEMDEKYFKIAKTRINNTTDLLF